MINTYNDQLLDFEPKMKSMVHNFRSCGYHFDGHDDDDLMQELFIKALEVRDRYDPERAALRTFWYTCFRSKLVSIAESKGSDKAMLWATSLSKMGDSFDVADPYFCCPIDWKQDAQYAVWNMIDELDRSEPDLGKICKALIQNDGIIELAALAIPTSQTAIRYGLLKLSKWDGLTTVLNYIPF